MKIGVDIDNVLLGYMDSFIKYHNEIYKTQFKIEDFQVYELWKTLGGTVNDDIKKIDDFSRTDHFKNLAPFPYSQESVKCLAKENDLVIITARESYLEKKTRNSIEKHFPSCFNEIHFTSVYLKDNKKQKTKREICDILNIDVLVEDSLDHSLDCVSQNRKVLLMDRPWNSCIDLPENIQRVNSWKEIVEII